MPRHRIDTFKLPAATVHGGTGLVGTGYLLEQLMAAPLDVAAVQVAAGTRVDGIEDRDAHVLEQ